nr:hypothetical protein [Kofleriaceae bacterium]
MARFGVLVTLLAACDLKPAPAKQKEPPPVAQPHAAPQWPPPQPPQLQPQLPVGSGADDGAPAKEVTADFVTHDCLDAAAHVIDLTLAGITDPKEQVIQGRKRAMMTRRTAEDCSKRPWTPETIRCFASADSVAKMRGCDKLLD